MAKKEIHVSKDGDDANSGALDAPLKTIQSAADRAYPGDTITVHEGVYREYVNPPRGGTSDRERITYRAADGESVTITGAERVSNWKHQSGNVWMVEIDNDFFGGFNPFVNVISGDWFFPHGRKHHTGAIYIDGVALGEANALDDLYIGRWSQWFASQATNTTLIWARFDVENPNEALVEMNTRQSVFYPSQPGMDFITVKGFTLTQAATPWSPPTTEQIGLVGVNWSKGWIIEDNIITHSRCTGITLGKYFDRDDAKIDYGFNAHYQTVKRVLDRGDWTKEKIGHHLIRNNEIAFCEQAGIVGSHGGAFSTITGNVIHDIHMRSSFGGFEQAGIKLHAPVDTTIHQNLIYNCNMGIWIDWMDQGARVSSNVLYDNKDWDLFIEISHGPVLVDHNFFLSDVSLLDSAQGGAYVHNLFGGKVRIRQEYDRHTQYFAPHSTDCIGTASVGDGDERFFNNILLDDTGLKAYDACKEESWFAGNAYLYRAEPTKFESGPMRIVDADTRFRVETDRGEVALSLEIDPDWWVGADCKLITTEALGIARVCEQRFENPDGTSLSLDADYFGRSRKGNPVSPGPLELKKKESHLSIWPPNAHVRVVGGQIETVEEIEVEPR